MTHSRQLKQGIKQELKEHGDSKLAKKIAADNLRKDPNFYRKGTGILRSSPKGRLKGSKGLLSNPTGLLGN